MTDGRIRPQHRRTESPSQMYPAVDVLCAVAVRVPAVVAATVVEVDRRTDIVVDGRPLDLVGRHSVVVCS